MEALFAMREGRRKTVLICPKRYVFSERMAWPVLYASAEGWQSYLCPPRMVSTHLLLSNPLVSTYNVLYRHKAQAYLTFDVHELVVVEFRRLSYLIELSQRLRSSLN
jgi:hypothetical protein